MNQCSYCGTGGGEDDEVAVYMVSRSIWNVMCRIQSNHFNFLIDNYMKARRLDGGEEGALASIQHQHCIMCCPVIIIYHHHHFYLNI